VKRLLLFAFVTIFASIAAATTVRPMSIEDLTSGATTIVEGQASDSWSGWNPQHTLIYTFTRFRVSRTLKGTADQTVLVKQLGGNAGGYTQKVAGVRALQPGDSSVLFLRPSESRDGTLVIVGLMQGNFRIEREARTGRTVVTNGVADVHEMNANGISEYRGAKMSLQQLEARVRKVAGE